MNAPSSPHSPVLPPPKQQQQQQENEDGTPNKKQNEVEQPSTSNNIENIEFSSQLSNTSSDEVLIKPLEPSSPDNELRRRRLERFESLSKKEKRK